MCLGRVLRSGSVLFRNAVVLHHLAISVVFLRCTVSCTKQRAAMRAGFVGNIGNLRNWGHIVVLRIETFTSLFGGASYIFRVTTEEHNQTPHVWKNDFATHFVSHCRIMSLCPFHKCVLQHFSHAAWHREASLLHHHGNSSSYMLRSSSSRQHELDSSEPWPDPYAPSHAWIYHRAPAMLALPG